MSTKKQSQTFNRDILVPALWRAVLKLDPRWMVRNPVMFVVEIGALLTLMLTIDPTIFGGLAASRIYNAVVTIILLLTVLFANFAEAVAEGRGRAQAAALRRVHKETQVKKLSQPKHRSKYETIASGALRKGDVFLVETSDVIPADGEVIEGTASVDESAITGESAPVIRESGGDRSAVTGGTRILSDWLIVKVTASPGEGFIERMIAMVESARRQKTPNEIALTALLAVLTLVFLIVCVTLVPFADFLKSPLDIATVIALLVCLIPTTIGALLSAIGIAGMDRLIQRNVIASSGRAVEAAGDVDVLLLDKTGTITLGNRQAVDFVPVGMASKCELAEAAQLASLSDETPEGRSIVLLAKEMFGLRGDVDSFKEGSLHFVPFSAQTRMSGIDMEGNSIRKGASDAIAAYIDNQGKSVPAELNTILDSISHSGGTPLVVARNGEVLGVVHLKDIVKGGIKERFSEMRKMGIKTVMITGDNPLTAATIAAEAGVDDFMAQATPEAKLKLIREYQAGGRLVGMTGDGTNDAPALAQADVAVAMNTGTQPAREAANMIDLDSNPTKLIEIVEIGKQLLITRGAITTFSIANDVAKYFAIIPAMFIVLFGELRALNIMQLATPHSAILSAMIFNAIIIPILIPLALRGVTYRPASAGSLLLRNIMIYGAGGVIAPFIGIKLIDLLIAPVIGGL
ncbi:MAG: potassium-transporting ATPase subunit KdpB [Dehalococcoidia bacterium]|jgi:K+-transporting ATPase ATPase B chain